MKVWVFIKKWFWVILALIVCWLLWRKVIKSGGLYKLKHYEKAKKFFLKQISRADREYWRLGNEKKTEDDFKRYSRSDILKFVRKHI